MPVDNGQNEEVLITSAVGLVHLLTKFDGAVQLRLDDLTMRGTVLTGAQ